MTMFKINGKEFELKLTYKAVALLNKQFDGGSYELIGNTLAGDFDAFPKIVHAGLIHTGEDFSIKDVEQAIEEAYENREITFESMRKIGAELVTESFFYKPTVEKLLEVDAKAKEAYEMLMK